MITASYYVIRNISDALEKKDLTEVKEIFEKFMERYRNDLELRRICEEFMEYLESGDEEILEKIKEDLEKLRNARRIRSQGGTGLWHRDRRPGLGRFMLIT
ncbi:MAG: hypothetical protein DRO90_02240 [Candidatus Altiarchaeales archaeon]|nr:MAG: hypothetical protein DRO95_01355 [Candidatus Altiarchaeales archaeon]RLI94330.1 MAG: hypothetical protein DRO90_02240 [Candidatus Altiarchaeales archaeon]RLI95087.1 MAG: hypothetical protein DRO94_01405 [Candidatus Altiarchaeales archaeon]HDO82204.1 hypothetical protein [Candidatus Altiarchaeales archaeon]HEX54853.1 hypothetical protein [Candidatus Altiarchaeales archaeon]